MSKYNAIRTTIDGITFDSRAEGRRYQELRLLASAGEIADIELQPKYPLVVNGVNCGHYKADFRYKVAGVLIVEDVKGVKTPVYQLKKKLVKALYGIEILET
jgi:hypothetical protein